MEVGAEVQPDSSVRTAYEAPVDRLEYAGFWIRLVARLIDLIIMYAVSFCVGFVVAAALVIMAVMTGASYASAAARFGETTALSFVLALIANVAYGTLAEGFHGSTPGKMAVGLTVLGQDGGFCSPGSALGRSLAFYIDTLFFALPAFVTMRQTNRQQRLGDKWAKTVVVRRRSVHRSQLRPVGRFIGVTCAVVFAYSLVIAVSLFF
ncbi:MAG: RDD family protein [Coriobacteriia bacterium]|nr:RDD family protein [Coriobacteriia bacterium]